MHELKLHKSIHGKRLVMTDEHGKISSHTI